MVCDSIPWKVPMLLYTCISPSSVTDLEFLAEGKIFESIPCSVCKNRSALTRLQFVLVEQNGAAHCKWFASSRTPMSQNLTHSFFVSFSKAFGTWYSLECLGLAPSLISKWIGSMSIGPSPPLNSAWFFFIEFINCFFWCSLSESTTSIFSSKSIVHNLHPLSCSAFLQPILGLVLKLPIHMQSHLHPCLVQFVWELLGHPILLFGCWISNPLPIMRGGQF